MSRRSALLAPPDDPHGAARTAAALMFSGGLYSLALMFVVPGWSGDHVLQGLFLAGIWLVAGSAFLHADRLVPAWGWSVAAHLAPPAVAFTNIATDDATAGSRLFLLWPVIYAAMHHNVAQVISVMVVMVASNIVVTSVLLPSIEGVTDVASMTLIAVVSGGAVVQLRRRADGLFRALEAQALEDQLTGLPNRRAFDRAIAAAASLHQRQGVPSSLLTFDVDHFKAVNDRDGHQTGDRVLREIGQTLRSLLRPSDTAARLGGDEFVVLAQACDATEALEFADRIRRAVSDRLNGITVSVGCATLGHDADDDAGLFRAADTALYAAKRAGRNRTEAASPELTSKLAQDAPVPPLTR